MKFDELNFIPAQKLFSQTATEAVSALKKDLRHLRTSSVAALCILLLHWDDSLPSQCHHFCFTWVQPWHPSLGRRRGPEAQWAKSPSFLFYPSLCPSSCPVTLAFPRSPPSSAHLLSPPSAALDRWHWSASHQRWDSKGDACQNNHLISVVMAMWPRRDRETGCFFKASLKEWEVVMNDLFTQRGCCKHWQVMWFVMWVTIHRH